MSEGANTVAAERALRVGLPLHLHRFEGVGSVSSVAVRAWVWVRVVDRFGLGLVED